MIMMMDGNVGVLRSNNDYFTLILNGKAYTFRDRQLPLVISVLEHPEDESKWPKWNSRKLSWEFN